MAELEIHHETGHTADPFGQKVGVLAAGLAVLLAMATIESHRTHTRAVVLKSEANDQWSYYQSKRIKSHTIELGKDLVALLGGAAPAASETLRRYEAEHRKYEDEAKEVQREARKHDAECALAEREAFRFDLGEGFLELALVLSSLYFISRKRFFPVLGILAGTLGTVVAASGLLLR